VANGDVSNLLIEEYKALWNYYTCQINNLSGFRELYIKIFLVPSSVLATAALVLSKSISQPGAISTDIIFGSVALLLGIAFLMGVALFTSYYKELGNLGNYEQAMIDIREYLRATHHLASVLTVDKYRTKAPIAILASKHKKRAFYQSLLFSLGVIFIVGNSFLISLAMASFLASMKWSLAAWSVAGIAIGLGIVVFLVLSWWSYYLYVFYTGAGAAELSTSIPKELRKK
jgi:hypothetical protein